jgi:serine/threonine protein phosphatase PrpC
MQGFRKKMEDEHIHTIMPSAPDHLFLGVLDGHGGVRCASYVSGTDPRRNPEDKCLIEILEETKEWAGYLGSGKSDGTGRNIDLLKKALVSAFILMDWNMRMYLDRNPSIAKTFGGCTGVIVMITPEYIVCANAGDSRAIMSKIGKPTAIALSHDHKPNNMGERRRIEAAGGFIQKERVDGNLAVSRGFGDFEFKMDESKGPEAQKVSCIPDIIVYARDAHIEWIILACDGLWDVCSNERAIGLVREFGDSASNTIVNIAEKMCEKALELDSNDNISVIVVKLSNYKNHVIESTRAKPPSAAAHLNTESMCAKPPSAAAHLNTESTRTKPPSAVAHLNTGSTSTESTRTKPPSAVAHLGIKKS